MLWLGHWFVVLGEGVVLFDPLPTGQVQIRLIIKKNTEVNREFR